MTRKELFISKAIEKHNNIYDYSSVDYINNRTKVKIKCPVHGFFEQTPMKHLTGGCKKCGVLKTKEKRKKSNITFMCEAKQTHGDKYDYSSVKYENAKEKIIIICKTHGEFEQTPDNHIKGNGCPSCSYEKRRDNKESFIAKANLIHNNTYLYDNIVYKGSNELIEIICKNHGVFYQTATSHLQGKGCNECGNTYKGFSKTTFKKSCKNNTSILYIIECFNEQERFF